MPDNVAPIPFEKAIDGYLSVILEEPYNLLKYGKLTSEA